MDNKKKNLLSKKFISELRDFFLLLNHLSNEKRFMTFVKKHYVKWTEFEIVHSYKWFVGTIIEEICDLIIALEPFFSYPFDKHIDRGYSFPINYTHLCTNSNKGRFIYYLYNITSKELFEITNYKELFSWLRAFDKKTKEFTKLFSHIKIPVSRQKLFYKIEGLLNHVDNPLVVCRDMSFIQSRFFKDHIDYLNFFKNDVGDWISSKGFFVGIAYSMEFILGMKQFNQNLKDIIIYDLPFDNFSIEENGLYYTYSLNLPSEDYAPHEYIQIYSSSEGFQPLYKLIDIKTYNYFKNIFRLFDYLEQDVKINEDELIEISTDEFYTIDKYFSQFPPIKEYFNIDKILYYQNLYPLANDNVLRNYSFFKGVSKGFLDLLKENRSPLEIIVLHRFNNEIESKFLQKEIIKPIKRSNPLFFLNNLPKKKNLECVVLSGEEFLNSFSEDSGKNLIEVGYFIEVPTISKLKKNYSYWLGSFYFGRNYYSFEGQNAQVDNFIELANFSMENEKDIELSGYVINDKYNSYLFNLTLNNSVISFEKPSYFALFFSSDKEIEDKIKLDNYIKSYKTFENSFKVDGKTNKDKKDSLESLTYTLFKLCPGFEVIKMNALTESEEIDLIVSINSPLFYIFDILGSIILIECRNMKGKVDSPQIRDFGEKIRKRNLRGGIIISREGITGNKKLEGARLEIRDFALRGCTIITIDKKDLEDIANGTNPLYVLKRSYLRLYFKNLKKKK